MVCGYRQQEAGWTGLGASVPGEGQALVSRAPVLPGGCVSCGGDCSWQLFADGRGDCVAKGASHNCSSEPVVVFLDSQLCENSILHAKRKWRARRAATTLSIDGALGQQSVFSSQLTSRINLPQSLRTFKSSWRLTGEGPPKVNGVRKTHI